VLAHAGGAPEFTSTILVGVGMVVAWIGVTRLRERGFKNLPRWAGVAMIAVAPVLVVGSVVVPSLVWPNTVATGPRPSSNARIEFAQPSPGSAVRGGTLGVRILIEDGTIVQDPSTRLVPDAGHIHLFLDGDLLSMAPDAAQAIDVGDLAAGTHRLQAEFVAADHSPFDPRVIAAVTFVKEAP
jgi:hypothetical protein